MSIFTYICNEYIESEENDYPAALQMTCHFFRKMS